MEAKTRILPQVKALERNLAFIGEHTIYVLYSTSSFAIKKAGVTLTTN